MTGTWTNILLFSRSIFLLLQEDLLLTVITFYNVYLMSIDIEDAAHIEDLLVGECCLRDLEELPDDSQHGRHVSVIPGARER